MRKKHLLWLVVGLLVLIAGEGPLFAVRASDIVQGPCDVAVTSALLEDMVLTMFEGTGVEVQFECSPRYKPPAVCTKFTYKDTQGRLVRDMDCVEPASSLISYSTHGDQTLCEVLDELLHPRGYCWWTLGRRLCIDRAMKILNVERGIGYIHNESIGQTTILRLIERLRATSPVAKSTSASGTGKAHGVIVVEQHAAGFVVY